MKLSVKPEACIILAIGILILPVQWIISWMLAAWFHELCHYLMIRMAVGHVDEIRIGFYGAEMIADIPPGSREVLCAIAGPLGGVLLLSLLRVAPRLALCAFIQTVCNLLPIYPLDGGRILYGLLKRCCAKKADHVVHSISIVILLLLLLVAAWAAVCQSIGILPIVVVTAMIVKARKNTLQRKGNPGTIVLLENSRGKL